MAVLRTMDESVVSHISLKKQQHLLRLGSVGDEMTRWNM